MFDSAIVLMCTQLNMTQINACYSQQIDKLSIALILACWMYSIADTFFFCYLKNVTCKSKQP